MCANFYSNATLTQNRSRNSLVVLALFSKRGQTATDKLGSDGFHLASELQTLVLYKFIGYVNLAQRFERKLGTGTIHKNERDAKVPDDPNGSGEDERLLSPSKNERLWTR